MSDAVPCRRRLLLVDDEEPILFALHDFFSHREYAVTCATDVDEALAALSESTAGVPFDLLVADLRLSGTHGTEGLALVHYARKFAGVCRVIMLTGYGSREVARSAAELGVDAFLRKPIPLPELARIIDDLLATPR